MLLEKEIRSESELEDYEYCAASRVFVLSRHRNKYLRTKESGILLLELTQFNYEFGWGSLESLLMHLVHVRMEFHF